MPIVPYFLVVGSILSSALLVASWAMPPAEPLPYTSSFDGLPHPVSPPGETALMIPPREAVAAVEPPKPPPTAPAAPKVQRPKKKIVRTHTPEPPPFYAQMPSPYVRNFNAFY